MTRLTTPPDRTLPLSTNIYPNKAYQRHKGKESEFPSAILSLAIPKQINPTKCISAPSHPLSERDFAGKGAQEQSRPALEITSNNHKPAFKSRRPYTWPLIIDGVFQGEGELPSCGILDNGLPKSTLPPYQWPVIILHRVYKETENDDHRNTTDENNKVPAGAKGV